MPRALLFVYGTLRPDRAPPEVAPLLAGARIVGEGSVRGRLLDLGEFPGLVPDAAARVRGVLLDVPEEALPALDAYEECDAGLFARRRVRVALDDGGEADCWAYEYARHT